MSFRLALKRSANVLQPRQYVRKHYGEAFLYFTGLITGMYVYVPRGQGESITEWAVFVYIGFGLVRLWAWRTEMKPLSAAPRKTASY
jgi:hypothetical protein